MYVFLLLFLLFPSQIFIGSLQTVQTNLNDKNTLPPSPSNKTIVDPCDDFYEFVCGKWIVENPISGRTSRKDQFTILGRKVNEEMRLLLESPTLPSSPENPPSKAIEQAKQIYQKCMDTGRLNQRQRMAPLFAKIREFGYWPAVNGRRWRKKKFNLSKLLAAVAGNRNNSIFVDVSISEDDMNATRWLLHFDRGTLGLPREYFVEVGNPDANEFIWRELYIYRENEIAKIISFRRDARRLVICRRFAARAVNEILSLEKRLAAIQLSEEERRNRTQMYNIRRFSELSKILPQIDWYELVGWRVPAHLRDHLRTADPEVIVLEPNYFTELGKLLAETKPWVLANYVFSRFVDDWKKNEKTPSTMSGRWADCVVTASNKMYLAADALYVRSHFNEHSKAIAVEMAKELRGAMRQMLVENDWMDQRTKNYALEKLGNMAALIGFPELLQDNTALDKFYKDLNFGPNDSLAEITEKCWRWQQQMWFGRLLKPIDRFEFLIPSRALSAYYYANKNVFLFPAAILQAPFFNEHYSMAVNYGAIGNIIGHEITHAFDNLGSQYGKEGNLREWWTPETWAKFKSKTQCFIDQYSGFALPETADAQGRVLHVDGVLTQGENIADNGGLKQAFIAFQTSQKRRWTSDLGPEEKDNIFTENFGPLTPTQTFFIAFANCFCGSIRPETAAHLLRVDPHSPNRFRVNGAVMNRPEFAEAFQCAPGTSMNPSEPEKRCSLW